MKTKEQIEERISKKKKAKHRIHEELQKSISARGEFSPKSMELKSRYLRFEGEILELEWTIAAAEALQRAPERSER